MGSLRTLFILITFLSLEILILIYLFLMVFLHNFFAYFKDRYSVNKRKWLESKIMESIQNPQNIPYLSGTYDLLVSLENFSRKVQGEEFDVVKKHVISQSLLSKAYRYVDSPFWKKRNFAARVFSLFPRKEEEPLMLKLMDDKKFLVKSVVGIALVKIKSREGVKKLIDLMSRSTGYAYYFYKDILLQGELDMYDILLEEGMHSEDEKIFKAILSIFANKTIIKPIPFLEKTLQSRDHLLIKEGLNALVRNPQQGSARVFMTFKTHPDEEIRAVAAKGLALYPTDEAKNTLKEMIQDSRWKVRFQSALSLKYTGEVEFLKRLKPEDNQAVFDTAQYVLEFV